MSNNTRVFNATRRFYMKHKQAARAVENCACAWVEFGMTVRDLTLAEAIAARNHQASLREPLCAAELLHVVFRRSESAGQTLGAEMSRYCSNGLCLADLDGDSESCPRCGALARVGYRLVTEANRFAQI